MGPFFIAYQSKTANHPPLSVIKLQSYYLLVDKIPLNQSNYFSISSFLTYNAPAE